MIIPKLLLLLPLLLLAEAQNDSQRAWSNRLPLRRPVISSGFRPELTLSPTTNNPITTKQIPEFVTQQYVPPSSKNYEEVTTKGAEIASVSSLTSETQAPNRGKVGFTIIFSNSYTENPITTSSISPPLSLTPQRPIQRPPWSRPINRPQNSQPPTSIIAPSASTVNSSPSTAETSTLIVAPLTSTIAPYASNATPSTSTVALTTIAAEPTTSTAAPSISTLTPSTLTIANVEVAAKIPPANQEPGDRRPGFTIIFSDSYTKKPMIISPSPVSVVAPSISTIADNEITAKIPPASQDSEDKRPGYTIVFSDNDTKKPTTDNSSSETEAPNRGKLGFTNIFSNSYTENSITTSSISPPLLSTPQRPIQRPPWSRPINRPQNSQPPTSIIAPSASTVYSSPSTAETSTLIVAPSTSTIAPYASTATPSTSTVAPTNIAAEATTSTAAPSISTLTPSTLTIANVEIAAKIPPANQEPGDRRPGFTIIFSDSYTKKPMIINPSPVSVVAPSISTIADNEIMAKLPPASQDSEDKRPGYTIVFSDNDTKKPTTVNSSSETEAPNRGKLGFTNIFSNSYTENSITTSSISPPLLSTPQRPIQRPPWSRPINRPQNSQPPTSIIAPSASTVYSSPSTAETSTLIVAPSTSTIAPYASTATPSTSTVAPTNIAAEATTSTAAPSISTLTPSTLTIANVEIAAKIPPANQEPGDRRPGFTIIFSDSYTKKPMIINPSPVSVVAPSISTIADNEIMAKLPPASQDSEDKRPGYTIVFSDNDTKKQTTVNSSSETEAPNRGKLGFTNIFSNSYTENYITTSSISPPLLSTPQRPIQRPPWSRPINRPQNSQPPTSIIAPSASTVYSSPSTAETSTLIVAPSTSTVAPTNIAAEPTTSTAAPSTSTLTPSTLTIANVEVAAKIPPANQEPGDRRPGFTIIFSDSYTKKPMVINPSPVSVVAPSISTIADNEITAKIPPASQDSEDKRPGYTIVFSDNDTKKPTTINSSPAPVATPLASIVAPPSTSTVTSSTLTVTNVEDADKISTANQETKDRKPGYTIIFSDSSTKKPTTIVSPSVFVVTRQPIQNPVHTNPTTFRPTSTVNQNTVSYIPTQTTNLPPKKTTESYSIIIINNNGSDPNISSQQISNPSNEPSDATAGPSQNITITEVEPMTNKIVMPTSTTVYTSATSRPIPVRPFPSRPIPFRPTTSIPATSTPLVVVVPSKAPAPVTNTPVTTPSWRTSTTSITTSTTTWKPPTTWTTSTTSNPQKPWNPPTQSGDQQQPLQTNVINQLQDYICRDVNGYYSLENKCDEYILCKNYTAYKNTCPDGLHFNPVARYPAYPCAYPTEVKCQSPSVKQPAQPTSECPHRFGHFPVPNGDCGHFMMCQEGVATIMTCPPGLAFNAKISACDWSVNVPGCNPSAFEGFTCPAVKSDRYENSAITNYRYKNSCKNYIACHEGHPRLLSCDAGLSFDEAAAKCVESSLVKNCKS